MPPESSSALPQTLHTMNQSLKDYQKLIKAHLLPILVYNIFLAIA